MCVPLSLYCSSPSLCCNSGMYPMDQSDYTALRSAIDKLTLNDSSVTVQKDSSMALGAGWRYCSSITTVAQVTAALYTLTPL